MSMHPIDKYVGKKIRAGRLAKNMIQESLAIAIGITTQQIQKYEKATNRISASKLYEVAKVLDLPINYFFEGAEPHKKDKLKDSDPKNYLEDKECLKLIYSFKRINSSSIKDHIVLLVKSLVDK